MNLSGWGWIQKINIEIYLNVSKYVSTHTALEYT